VKSNRGLYREARDDGHAVATILKVPELGEDVMGEASEIGQHLRLEQSMRVRPSAGECVAMGAHT
jgi:hypothetical protein